MIYFVFDEKSTGGDPQEVTMEQLNNGEVSASPTSASGAADTRAYLSDSSLPFSECMLLSIRNILLLWFLCWFILTIHTRIKDGIKKMKRSV